MNSEIEPMQHLLLWRLAVGGGSDFVANLPDGIKKAERDVLIRAGLVTEEKKTNPTGKSKRGALFCSLTDAGWAWCDENMTWPSVRPSKKAAIILKLLMPRIKVMFQRGERVVSVGDFIGKTQTTNSESLPQDVHPTQSNKIETPLQDLHQTIRDACRALGNGREGVRIRLADLRIHLNGFPKDEVTNALWELSEKGELSLFRLDDPREIQPADREAAVLTSTGEEKHILLFGGMAS